MSNLSKYMDPVWYMQRLWWLLVILGAVLIVGTALANRRRSRKAESEPAVKLRKVD